MIKGFREFLLRGNVVDLAVAVVIGAAFGKVISAVVDGFVSPLIALVVGQPNLDRVADFHLGKGHFLIGTILSGLLNFVLIAGAIYFVIIVPMNKLLSLRKKGVEPEPEAPSEDVLLLQEIRDLLRARNTGV